jgi:hypothetical protein
VVVFEIISAYGYNNVKCHFCKQKWRGPKEIELKLVTDQIERERNPKRNKEQ